MKIQYKRSDNLYAYVTENNLEGKLEMKAEPCNWLAFLTPQNTNMTWANEINKHITDISLTSILKSM